MARRRGGVGDILNLLFLNMLFDSPGSTRGNSGLSIIGIILNLLWSIAVLIVISSFVFGSVATAIIVWGGLVLIFYFVRNAGPNVQKAKDVQETKLFTPTDEVAALLRRQTTGDKMRYLGCSNTEELVNKYPMCATNAEMQGVYQSVAQSNNTYYEEAYEPAYNPPQNDYKPVTYDDDDTYDNFYMQREDEYRQEYGDDFEDAIQDEWEEHQRDKNRR